VPTQPLPARASIVKATVRRSCGKQVAIVEMQSRASRPPTFLLEAVARTSDYAYVAGAAWQRETPAMKSAALAVLRFCLRDGED
jgi:fructose-specific component phosphotransferase system IIB-like protein